MLKRNKAHIVHDGHGGEISDQQKFLIDPPMLLIIGSVDAAKKADVLAYARGLIESQVIAKDACFVDALRVHGRWIFEIHEGGAGYSVTHWIAEKIKNDPRCKINIPLTGDRVASVSEASGDVVTVIHPGNKEKYDSAVGESDALKIGQKLTPFYGSAAPLRKAAQGVFYVAAAIFCIAGSAFFIKSSAIDLEKFAGRYSAANPYYRTDIKNLPSYQIDIAIKNIKASSGYLSYLKLEGGKWSWAQSTAAQPDQMGGGKNE